MNSMLNLEKLQNPKISAATIQVSPRTQPRIKSARPGLIRNMRNQELRIASKERSLQRGLVSTGAINTNLSIPISPSAQNLKVNTEPSYNNIIKSHRVSQSITAASTSIMAPSSNFPTQKFLPSGGKISGDRIQISSID